MQFQLNNYAALKEAIREICDVLASVGAHEDCVFNSRLAINELVGNVLRHTGGTASLKGEITDDYVEWRVCSETPFYPPKNSPCVDVYAEHGRGLYLVDSLCGERTVTQDGVICVRIKIKK